MYQIRSRIGLLKSDIHPYKFEYMKNKIQSDSSIELKRTQETLEIVQRAVKPLNDKLDQLIIDKDEEPAKQPQFTWFTKKQASEYLQVSERTIDSYIKKDLIPCSHFARRIYINLQDLQDLLTKYKTN